MNAAITTTPTWGSRGMIWAGVTALLRDRFNASEILVSLMLVYVAEQVLSYLVYGPWKDPAGYNFPKTVTFVEELLNEHADLSALGRLAQCANCRGQ